MRSQGVAQRRMDEVGGRVSSLTFEARGDIDLGQHRFPYRQGSHFYPHGVTYEPRNGLLDVNDRRRPVCSTKCSYVSNLPTRFGIQRRGGQDDLDLLPVGRTRHTLTIEQNSEDLRFGAQGVVSGEHAFSRGAELSIHRDIGQRGFFRLRIGLGALALFGHERIKTLTIHTQTRFLGNLQGEVNGEAIRVV